MAKINLTPGEFGDFVALFLFDKLVSPKEIIAENEPFNGLAKVMTSKGMKSPLQHYYLSVDSNLRMHYNRMKKSFKGKGVQDTGIIYIKEKPKRDQKVPGEKPSLLKRIAKGVLNKVAPGLGNAILKDDVEMSYEEIEMLIERVVNVPEEELDVIIEEILLEVE